MKTIQLTRGMKSIVDDEDFKKVSQQKWHFHKHPDRDFGYARTDKKGKAIFMHNIIMNNVNSDHINGNGLDNRRKNLRPSTRSQNMMNRRKFPGCSSKYKGVNWNKHASQWVSRITKDSQTYLLGYFRNEKRAASEYDAAAKLLHGDFARLNFPIKQS